MQLISASILITQDISDPIITWEPKYNTKKWKSRVYNSSVQQYNYISVVWKYASRIDMFRWDDVSIKLSSLDRIILLVGIKKSCYYVYRKRKLAIWSCLFVIFPLDKPIVNSWSWTSTVFSTKFLTYHISYSSEQFYLPKIFVWNVHYQPWSFCIEFNVSSIIHSIVGVPEGPILLLLYLR